MTVVNCWVLSLALRQAVCSGKGEAYTLRMYLFTHTPATNTPYLATEDIV